MKRFAAFAMVLALLMTAVIGQSALADTVINWYSDVSGWGPDYGDPQTYLDTFLPDYAGYMIKCIGLY